MADTRILENLAQQAAKMQDTLDNVSGTRCKDGISRFSIQCSNYSQTLEKSHLKQFIVLPAEIHQEINQVPELFRTMKLPPITNKLKEDTERIEEENISLEEQSDIKESYNDLSKKAENLFSQLCGGIADRKPPMEERYYAQPEMSTGTMKREYYPMVHAALGGIGVATNQMPAIPISPPSSPSEEEPSHDEDVEMITLDTDDPVPPSQPPVQPQPVPVAPPVVPVRKHDNPFRAPNEDQFGSTSTKSQAGRRPEMFG